MSENYYFTCMVADLGNDAGPEVAGAYIKGLRAGIRAHAVWRDGGQYVGALDRPLDEVLCQVTDALMAYMKLSLENGSSSAPSAADPPVE